MPTIKTPASFLKANGKTFHVESMLVVALRHGNVLVRMDDQKPRASFLITTPAALKQIAKEAKKVSEYVQKHDTLLGPAKTVKVRRP